MFYLFFEFFLKYLILSFELFFITMLSCSPLQKKEQFLIKTISYLILISIVCGILAYIRKDSITSIPNVFDIAFLITNYLFILTFSFISYKGDASLITCYINIALASFYTALKLSNGLNFLLQNNNINISNFIMLIIDSIIQISLLICSYIFIIKSYKKGNEIAITTNFPIIMFAIFAVVTIILGIIEIFLTEYGYSYLFFLSLINVLYGVITLSISYSVIQKEESQFELTILKKLWNEDKKQYSLLKENIEIINIRCHDLKHQFNAFKNKQNIDAKFTKEIEDSIDIYNSKIKTENEVLDIILTDYNLRSINNSIELTCMADGKLLNFMEETDLYSLFGNMLSNAFEYEQKVDKENRFISLTITQEGKYAHIHCENYYEGENLVKINERYLSSKKEQFGHGFGMISMERIISKYHGEFHYKIADMMFQLDIMIPLGGKR